MSALFFLEKNSFQDIQEYMVLKNDQRKQQHNQNFLLSIYYFLEENLLFCGDTLFSMGCGRLFEGTAIQMHHSLDKLTALPPTTQLFCAHEYTQQNGQFAQLLEPNNAELQQRINEGAILRQNNIPTIPSTLAQEKATNPFLRTHSSELVQSLAMTQNSKVEIFTEIRRRKDHF